MEQTTEEIAAAWRRPFLEGRRAVVTAGASGIGRAIADLLIAQGCRTAICDIDEDRLADFRGAYPDTLALRADVAEENDVDALFDTLSRKFGGLDILVNNAGIAGPTGAVEEITPADWRRCIDVNLTGQFLCARRAAPMLKAAGGGAIVNISSVAGRHGYAFRTPYASAKYGVIGLTESLAKELGPAGIRVNAVLPGIVEGPRIQSVIRARAEQLGISEAEMESRYLRNVSLRRMVTAEDVAATVAFLVSPMGANIAGQSLGVCGNVESL